MKHASLILLLTLCFIAPQAIWAQSAQTPGIMAKRGVAVEDVTSELFRRKQKQADRSRNGRMRDQNLRLERQILNLEQELDACMDASRRRYPKRRPDARYDLRKDYLGERRAEKEYQRLREENEYLRDQRDWLVDELDACAASQRQGRDRGRDRGRDYRDNDRYEGHSHCSCHQHHPAHSKGKHKGKHKGKSTRCRDND